MNKIYKVIYSKVKQCYIVVSEIAKSHGKEARSEHTAVGNSYSRRLAVAIALAISCGGLLYPMQAEASTAYNNYFTAYNDDYFNQDGTKNKDWNKHKKANTISGSIGAKGTGAIAAGMFAQAGQQTVTIGNRNAGMSMGSVFVGEYDHKQYDNPDGNDPQGLGNYYVTAVGFMSNATKYGTIAIGADASAEGEDNNVNFGKKDSTGTLTTSLPEKPTIKGASVALGYSATAKAGNIAIGAYSDASKDLSIDTSDAAKSYLTSKTAKSYVSVGKRGDLRRISNVADGAADTDVATIAQLKEVATAAGQNIHFYGVKDSSITSKADGNNYNGGGASGEKTVAIGPNVVVSGTRSNSVGYGNTVKGTLSDVYGNGNMIAEGTNNAVVLGNSNKVGSNSVAIGTWDKANATNSVFIGGNDVSASNTTAKKGWSVGVQNADGTYTEVASGGIVEVTSDDVHGGLDFAKKNNFTDDTSWDDDTTTASAKAASFGIDIGGTGSTGTTTDTMTGTTTDETTDKVTVVGKSADATGTGSVSVGYGAKSANGNVAIGYNSQATTAIDSSKKGYLTTADAPSSYVSVGDGMDKSAAKTRRIINVADGSDDQDAATVAQLKKQEEKLTNTLSVKPGWGINKTDDTTISVKHNLSSGTSAYADTDAKGLILGGSIKNRNAAKTYGAATESSVIVGAQNALASNDNSVVVGGADNVASGANSTVVGGDNNKASGNQSAVFGGRDNTASGIASTAGGGIMNVANGQQSTAIGGSHNYALGTQTSHT